MTNKTTYLKFYSDRCPPCKNLDIQLENIDVSNVDIISINIRENISAKEKYKIRNIPFIVKLIDGKEVERFHGSYLIEDIKKVNKAL